MDDEEDLKNLDNIPFDELKSGFQMGFMTLKNKIYKEALPKKINGKKLNGSALATLLEIFVGAINSGAIPNISNAWDSVIEKDIKDYYNKALGDYKLKISQIKGIYEQEEIISRLSDLKHNSLAIFNKVATLNPDAFSNSTYSGWLNKSKAMLEEELGDLEYKAIDNNLNDTIM